MKKFITILAIAAVSLNFVSCRQDDVTSEMGAGSQENVSFKKTEVTAKTDTVTSVAKRQAQLDPDPPVKDNTNW
ncbi:hypothetical protein [Epilithonimonas sp.]|uniref:hypothetical protein n=1 Tax=Epilithonimonas sp. TaxID=2894511 RepID=UPI002FDE3756